MATLISVVPPWVSDPYTVVSLTSGQITWSWGLKHPLFLTKKNTLWRDACSRNIRLRITTSRISVALRLALVCKCPFARFLLAWRDASRLCPLVSYTTVHSTLFSVKFFSKLNSFFSGYFDPINYFFDSKNKCFSGWPKRYFGKNGNTACSLLEMRTCWQQMSFKVSRRSGESVDVLADVAVTPKMIIRKCAYWLSAWVFQWLDRVG